MFKILIFIAENGFQNKEYGDTKAVLEKHGHETKTISTSYSAKDKLGSTVKVDLLLNETSEKGYDAIAFIGGPGSYDYFHNQKCHELAQDFFIANKIVAAICAAPSIIANAGILKNKKATCFSSEIENLKNQGGVYTANHNEIDGKIITADGPMAAEQFGEDINQVLQNG